jgi:hypothetical protein
MVYIGHYWVIIASFAKGTCARASARHGVLGKL